MEATPGIEIQGKRLPSSRSASNSQSITRIQRSTSCQSPSFRMSVHEVVPNPYQIPNMAFLLKPCHWFATAPVPLLVIVV